MSSTEKAFPESKSIFRRGLAEELLAAQFILQKNSKFILKFQRLKTTYGEVDLVFYDKSQDQILVYEVKKWNGLTPPDQRISTKQILRLKKICFYLCEKYQKKISLELILVHKNKFLTLPLL